MNPYYDPRWLYAQRQAQAQQAAVAPDEQPVPVDEEQQLAALQAPPSPYAGQGAVPPPHAQYQQQPARTYAPPQEDEPLMTYKGRFR